jgi:hypothetical protein
MACHCSQRTPWPTNRAVKLSFALAGIAFLPVVTCGVLAALGSRAAAYGLAGTSASWALAMVKIAHFVRFMLTGEVAPATC